MIHEKHIFKGDKPFSVKRIPVYYGWVILVAGALGVLFSVPGQTMGVSVYTDHLIENLHLSRIQISTAYMIGTLISASLMTFAGLFYDKYGARIAAAGASLFLGIFVIFLSKSVELTAAINGFTGLNSTGIAFVLMVIGFLGIRFFGQGVLTLVSRGMVMRWFNAHRGFAAALMGIVTTFGFSYAPRILQGLINMSGWAKSWFYIGLVLIAVVLPFILLIFRDSPEDCEIEMEEGVKLHTGGEKKRHEPDHSYTLEEARKDPQLWFYLFLVGFWALYNTAFTFHVTSIYAAQGLNATQAVAIFLPISIISVIARFLVSWLSDMVKMKYIFYAMVITSIVSGLSVSLPYSTGSNILLIIFMGLTNGIFGAMNAVTWPKLYGREHLGAISGLGMSFMVAGSALGPIMFSVMEDIWGHYRYTGYVAIIVVLIIGLLSLTSVLKSDS